MADIGTVISEQQVIVVTYGRVPYGIYWLSSDLGPRAEGRRPRIIKQLESYFLPSHQFEQCLQEVEVLRIVSVL